MYDPNDEEQTAAAFESITERAEMEELWDLTDTLDDGFQLPDGSDPQDTITYTDPDGDVLSSAYLKRFCEVHGATEYGLMISINGETVILPLNAVAELGHWMLSRAQKMIIEMHEEGGK